MSQEGDVRIGGVEAGGGEPENQVEQPAGGEVEEGTTPPTMSAEEAAALGHPPNTEDSTAQEVPDFVGNVAELAEAHGIGREELVTLSPETLAERIPGSEVIYSDGQAVGLYVSEAAPPGDEVTEDVSERRGPPTREEREREATAKLHERRAEGKDT